jgi:hypothetical protein
MDGNLLLIPRKYYLIFKKKEDSVFLPAMSRWTRHGTSAPQGADLLAPPRQKAVGGNCSGKTLDLINNRCLFLHFLHEKPILSICETDTEHPIPTYIINSLFSRGGNMVRKALSSVPIAAVCLGSLVAMSMASATSDTLIVSGKDNYWKTGAITTGSTATVTVNENQKYQKWIGFGGCFNEAGWEALKKLSAGDRDKAMKLLFDKKDGIGFT